MRRRVLTSAVLMALLWAVPPVTAETPSTAPAASADRTADVESKLAAIDALIRTRRLGEAKALAEPLFADVRERLGADHATSGPVALRLGIIEARLGNPQRARELLQRTLTIETRRGGRATRDFKAALDELAAVEFAAGRGESVSVLYAAVFEGLAAEQPDGSLAEAVYRDDWGNHARRLGRFAEAEDNFRKAIALKERLAANDAVAIARSLNNLAGVLRVVGRYQEASESYVRAIALWKQAEGSDNPNVGILTDNLGVLYLNMGRTAEAEAQHRQAVQIFERALGQDHPTTAVGVANLAEVFRHLDRYDEAEPLFLRALAILRRHATGPDHRLAVALDNLGGIYRERRQFSKALDSYQEALKIFRQIYPADHPTVGVTTNNIGLSLLALRRFDDASEWFERALAIAERSLGPDHREVATQLLNVGDLAVARRDYPAARKALARAISINEAVFGGSHERLAAPLTLIGRAELAAGDPKAAIGHLRRAVAIHRAFAAPTTGLPGGRDDERQRSTEAAALLVEALWQDAGGGDPEARSEAFKAAQLSALTAAGGAVAKLGARLAVGDGLLATKVRRRQDLAAERVALDKRLIAAVSSPPERREAATEDRLRASLANMDLAIARLDAEVQSAFPEFAALTRPQPLDLADAQKTLAGDEALVLVVPAAGALHIFAVTRDETRWIRGRASLSQIVDDVARLRCGLDQDNWIGEGKPERCIKLLGRLPEAGLMPFDVPAARRLYDQILAPVGPLVAGRHMFVVVTGPLASIPFQVLVTEDAKGEGNAPDLSAVAWLAKKNPVTMIPSVASLFALRASNQQRAPSPLPYLAIANPLLLGPEGDDRRAFLKAACPPRARKTAAVAATAKPALAPATLVRGGVVDRDAVERLAPLPETTDEVCEIARTLGAAANSILLAEHATERKLKAFDGTGALRRYRILHFATHGLVAGDLAGLAEPALVLTPPAAVTGNDDGLLQASEVAALRLDADWVILSACNTAAGDGATGEALSGLARAFFYAGARALLVSHWPVRSDAAVRLTTAAFDEMKRKPDLARSEALRRSMLALLSDRTDPSFAHPQVWAPFTVVGEGGPDLEAAARGPAGAERASRAKSASRPEDQTSDWKATIFKQ